MDASRFKRREIQTRRQTPEIALGSSDIVPQVLPSRPPIEPQLVPEASPASPIKPSQTPRPRRNFVSTDGMLAPSPKPVTDSTGEPSVVTAATVEQVAANSTVAAVTPQTLPPIDMGLPGDASPSRSQQTVVHLSRWAGIRRWTLRAAIAVIVIVVGAGSLLFSQGYLKLHKVFKGGAATAAALTVNVNPNLLKGEGDGRVNVLMLGRGGGNHDGPDLTDTMLLASIDPINHTSTLLSIPRDLWVDVPNQGAMKINAAWETGEFKYLGKIAPGSTNTQAIQAGFAQADQTVESVLGVPIHYNVLVDFQAFQQAIDTVGGVTINVPTDLIDPTMAWQNGNSAVLARAGLQTFDGGHALNYVRSRETTSDFARSQRQRSVLVSLKNKVDTLGTLSNPIKIAGLLSAFGNNVQTDLSLGDASRLYSILKDVTNSNIGSVGLSDAPNHFITTANMNGQSIDEPVAGLFDYTDIQNYVRTQLKDGYIVKENAKVLVLNGTDLPGVATAKAAELKGYGYNVIGMANAPTSGYATSVVVDLTHGKDKYTAHYLQQRFNTNVVTTLPDTTIQTNGADFVIIIGSDEATTPKI